MKITTITTGIIIAASALVSSPASAETDCYVGTYQGAPIEVCMPTGATLPQGTTMANGDPVVIHVSKDYVAPVVDEVAIEVVDVPVVKTERKVWAPETVRQAEPRA